MKNVLDASLVIRRTAYVKKLRSIMMQPQTLDDFFETNFPILSLLKDTIDNLMEAMSFILSIIFSIIWQFYHKHANLAELTALVWSEKLQRDD